MSAFVGFPCGGNGLRVRDRLRTCSTRQPARLRRSVIKAEVDVSSFPNEPTKDALQSSKPLEEYAQLKEMLRGTSIFLVGMMGSGKSAVGKVIAEELKFNYLDTDELIQTLMKAPITEIFEVHGETGFRQVESAVLSQVAAYVRTVVSTGGGIVSDQQNWGALQNGLVVWLDPSVDILYDRLKGDVTRPLLQVNDPKAQLESILDERRKYYEQADIRVVIEEGEAEEEVAFNVVRGLTRFIQMK